jgi:hypothetical protein
MTPSGTLLWPAGAADMTRQDVADVSKDIVRELALQLSLLEAQQQQQQQQQQPGLQQCGVVDKSLAALSGLRAAFDRWVSRVGSLGNSGTTCSLS